MSETSKELNMVLEYQDYSGDERAVSARNQKAVMDALDAVKNGDFELFWALFDPEVVFHEAPCLPYGGSFVGFEAAKKAYLNLSSHYAKMNTVVKAVLAGHDYVIIYQTIAFEVAANGNKGGLPVSEMLRFRNGKVIEWRALYFDAAMVTQLLTEK
jgi:ketosteroid isomerase-like protein